MRTEIRAPSAPNIRNIRPLGAVPTAFIASALSYRDNWPAGHPVNGFLTTTNATGATTTSTDFEVTLAGSTITLKLLVDASTLSGDQIVPIDLTGVGTSSTVSITVPEATPTPVLLPAVPESDPPNPEPVNNVVTLSIDEGNALDALLDFDATDADGGSVSYSLSGPDAAHFGIDGFGVLSPTTVFNHATPVDADTDNVLDFNVVITAQRDQFEQLIVNIQLTVNDVVEPPELLAPSLDPDGVLRVTYEEGLTSEIFDLDVLNSTYAITGGADSALITIDGFGQGTPASAFNFSAPTDANGDNIAEIVVTATSQSNPASQRVIPIEITILDATATEGPELFALTDYRMDGTEWTRLKGLGIAHLNNLYNWTLKRSGSNDRIVSYQFRADRTGTISGLHLYWIAAASSGYSNGDGGVIDIRVFPDDGTINHYPNTSASTLAQTTYTPNLVEPNGTAPGGYGIGPFLSLSWAVTKGEIYHVVFRNIAASPTVDYIALDAYSGKSAQPDVVPFLGRNEWRVLRQDTPPGVYQATWKDQTNELIDTSNYTSPIMAIDYGSGKPQGITLMESGNVIVSGGTDRLFVATASNPVRTRIQPDANWDVQKWFLWAAFKVGGSMQVTLQNNALSTIEQFNLTQSADYVVSGTSMIYNSYSRMFDSVRTLSSGQTYYLEYRPLGSCQVGMAAVRDYRHGGWPNVVQDSQLFRSERYHSGGWHTTNFYSHNATGQTEREAFLDCLSLT